MKPKLIVATSANGVIGIDGKIPWRKPEDLKRFKQITLGGVLIMGRRTWDSIGRALPGRRTFVLSSNPDLKLEGAEVFSSLPDALAAAGETDQVWIAGGSSVYAEGLQYCDELDITVVNSEVVEGPDVVTIPWFVALRAAQRARLMVGDFHLTHQETNPADGSLVHCKYNRITSIHYSTR
jgi:dihydrofolate reductase